jgi:hypothetical protein
MHQQKKALLHEQINKSRSQLCQVFSLVVIRFLTVFLIRFFPE